MVISHIFALTPLSIVYNFHPYLFFNSHTCTSITGECFINTFDQIRMLKKANSFVNTLIYISFCLFSPIVFTTFSFICSPSIILHSHASHCCFYLMDHITVLNFLKYCDHLMKFILSTFFLT